MTKAAKWVVFGALFIIPFLPLYVANELFFPFITGKGFAFRILVEIAFGAWVALAFLDKQYRPKFSWTFVIFTALIVWMAIADAFGVNPHKAFWSNFERMDGYVTLIHMFLLFVVAGAFLPVENLWKKWWYTFIAVAAVVCCYSVLQLSGLLAIHQGGRVDSTFGNAAYLAAYLLFALAITLWLSFETKGWFRYALYALAALEAFITFATATRGAVLGLLGAVGVGAVLWMIDSGKRGRQVALGVLVALIVIAGGFFLMKDTPLIQKDLTLQRISSISEGDLSVRFTLWHMAILGTEERPITGWGQEGFNYIFNKYYQPSLFQQEPWFDRAHDIFFDWLVAGGIPALLLFLSLLGSAVVALHRKSVSKPERVLLLAALVAYAIQGVVVFDNLFTYVPLAIILAMAHSMSSRPYKKLEAAKDVSDEAGQMILPIVAVITLVVVWIVNVPNIAAASQLVRAISPLSSSNDISGNVSLFQQALAENTYAKQEVREQLMIFTSNIAAQQPAPSEALNNLVQLAMTEMGKEVDSEPKDARLRLEYALGYRVIGDNADAIKQIDAARQLSPRKQSIILEEGISYWQAGDYKNASLAFNAAYQLDTSFPEIAVYAAAGDIANGDVTGGKALLMQTNGTTTVDSEPLILAYYQEKQWSDLISVLKLQLNDQSGAVGAYFRLAAAYVAAGDYADAKATVSAAVTAHPDAAAQAADFLTHIPGAGK